MIEWVQEQMNERSSVLAIIGETSKNAYIDSARRQISFRSRGFDRPTP